MAWKRSSLFLVDSGFHRLPERRARKVQPSKKPERPDSSPQCPRLARGENSEPSSSVQVWTGEVSELGVAVEFQGLHGHESRELVMDAVISEAGVRVVWVALVLWVVLVVLVVLEAERVPR